jgi:hypothetical protein
MPFIHKPIINQWYRHLDKGDRFQVVAIDDDERTVEIQDFDGDIEEIDRENWYTMDIEPIGPPEDSTGPMGPMDDIERDDLGYNEPGLEETAQEWGELSRDELTRRLTKREEEIDEGEREDL